MQPLDRLTAAVAAALMLGSLAAPQASLAERAFAVSSGSGGAVRLAGQGPNGEPALYVTSLEDSGDFTLRASIAYIKEHPKGPRRIVFDPMLEGHAIGLLSPLRIETQMEIVNEHPGLIRLVIAPLPGDARGGEHTRRLLIVNDGDDQMNSAVSISGLAFVGASTHANELYSDPLEFSSVQASGAAILSREPLSLSRCLISGNEANSVGLSIYGGAVASIRDLEIDDCEISDNTVNATNYYPVGIPKGSAGGACGDIGGACGPVAVVGLAGFNRPTLTVTDSRFLRNVSVSATDGNQPFSGFATGVLVSNADAVIGRTLFLENVARNELTAGPNAASEGAAIYVDEGRLTLTDSEIHRNRSEVFSYEGHYGFASGAIALSAMEDCAALPCRHSIQRTVVRGNLATVEQSEPAIDQVSLTGWASAGSGVRFRGAAGWELDVDSSEFSNGVSSADVAVRVNVDASTHVWTVGALMLEGAARIVNSTVSGNQSNAGLLHEWQQAGFAQTSSVLIQARAAGIHAGSIDPAGDTQSVEIHSSTIANNRAQAVFDQPEVVLPMQSIDGTAMAEGGGVYSGSDAELVLRSSLVVDNELLSVSTPDLERVALGMDLRGQVVASHSMLSDSNSESNNFVDGVDGNLIDDPWLTPLRNNGGPTWTHELAWNSVAIGRGSNELSLPADQRGFEPRVVGADADMGAYECGAVATSVDEDLIFYGNFDGDCD